MNTRVIDFSQLNYDLTVSFAASLRNNDFEIVGDYPNEKNYPEGLYEIFIKRETYCEILEDSEATCTYLFLRFKIFENNYGDIPIGVFGTSHKRGMNYPLLAGTVLRGFLEISKSDFKAMMDGEEEDQINLIYSTILSVRMFLMRKIFLFYANFDKNYNSIMSWKLRNKASITRRVAESIPFIRKEKQNKDVEYYSSKELNEVDMVYLGRCSVTWDKLTSDSSSLANTPPKINTASEFDLSIFYKELAIMDKGEDLSFKPLTL